jgi:hypothetical protein
MKCPGCGAEIAEGSEYCNGCSGKITGSTIDYSQMRKKASDVYEVSASEPLASESFDQYDEHVALVMWVRFPLMLLSFPLLAILFVVTGLEEKRTDLLYVGAFFTALSILATALAIKFYRGKGGWGGKERRSPPPRFSRRI